ncbi:MAG TPA: (2Fe-2S)-binding protein [Thermoanaerobaculia bacterium]
MFVCVCRAVSDATIKKVIGAGASTVDEVGARCGAGTSCGACRPIVLRMLANHEAQDDCGSCPLEIVPIYSRAS